MGWHSMPVFQSITGRNELTLFGQYCALLLEYSAILEISLFRISCPEAPLSLPPASLSCQSLQACPIPSPPDRRQDPLPARCKMVELPGNRMFI